MTKSQLMRLLHYKNPELNEEIIARSVDAILVGIASGIRDKKHVEIRGFGTFENRQKKEKTLRHPVTSKLIKVSTYNSMHYSYSSKLLTRV